MAPRRLVAVLAFLNAAAAGASPFMMPEGTRELAVGAVLGSREEDEGGGKRAAYLMPYLDARWSNGVFLQGFTVGMQLSEAPGIGYGPLLTLGRERSARPGRDTRLLPVFGAFVEYRLLHNLQLGVDTYRMAGSRGGTTMNLQLATHHSLAAQHTLVVGAGLRLADRRYLRAQLGAEPDASGGVKDSHVEGRWEWEPNPKYRVFVGFDARRLHGAAARGALVERRNSVGYSLMLLRSY
ncbi:MipA/OmpV family protein [Massilia sp. Leaf139]|uniref:MipA/OmpV family protein n=1 Tax=Massilia sp. Leaf139 TaxID=1736272 RepID=UPI000B24A6B0|nr:MipA/OmpV family protein [Massilia sp. Leaf139]